jgi:hypothetical protein
MITGLPSKIYEIRDILVMKPNPFSSLNHFTVPVCLSDMSAPGVVRLTRDHDDPAG